MKFTFNTEGMACEHCEKRLVGVLSQIDGVISAKANAKTGTVEVQATDSVQKETLKEAILDAGFEVKE